jgi:hypothetical protein
MYLHGERSIKRKKISVSPNCRSKFKLPAHYVYPRSPRRRYTSIMLVTHYQSESSEPYCLNNDEFIRIKNDAKFLERVYTKQIQQHVFPIVRH